MARLADITDLKTFLGIDQADCENDRAYGDLLDRASAFIVDLAGQPLVSATEVHRFCGTGSPEMNLPHRSITAVTEVVAERATFDDADETVSSADYRLQSYAGGSLLIHRTAWDCGRRFYATLTVGPATIPKPVRDATVRLAANIAAKSRLSTVGRNRLGLSRSQETAFPTSTDANGVVAFGKVRTEDVTPEIVQLISPYMKSRYW